MKKNVPIYQNAAGPVPISMTNDYLFKALLQKNEKVLRALICSLLHLKPEDLWDIQITNPIILGESINDKDIVLDVNVSFNDGRIINLEMQVVNKQSWPERSTYYACRNYATLKAGQDYLEINPIHQIGILNFTPLTEHPRFYSVYQLSEIHDHHIYTDKFNICTLDLTHIDLATDEDKAYNIDIWAALFKSQTWEDIKMLAAKYDAVNEAATTLYQLSEDERIRLQCQAREDYERDQRTTQHAIADLSKALAGSQKELADSKKELADSQQRIAELEAQLAKLKSSSIT